MPIGGGFTDFWTGVGLKKITITEMSSESCGGDGSCKCLFIVV